MKFTVLITAAVMAASSAWAKLPALSEEAKAKAAEAAAKTAHAGKVDGYKLCKSMDQVAATYHDQAKKAGKTLPAPTATAPCADPGPFVYTPPTAPPAGGAPAAAAGTAPSAAPAAAVKAAVSAPAGAVAAAAPKK